jgi:hypothetical protein
VARLDVAIGAATTFSGSLAGDVTGTQFATHVARIDGVPLAPLGGAGIGQVLTYSGGSWGPGNVVTSLLAGAGIDLSSLTGDILVGIPLGGVTNDLLANPAITLITGNGLSGGTSVPLGGALTLQNTGLLSLAALPPLAVTGGQTPSLSLSGIVPVGNGGTGASTAAGALAALGAAASGANSDITALNGLSGVNGNLLSALTSLPVYITSGGALGVVGSSARFKEGIRDMRDESAGLLSLRPVRFRYRRDIDPSGADQYGLIAEEVARVYPELVAYDDDGRPYTVRYEVLTPMLLNEVQRQARRLASQEEQLRRQASAIEALGARLADLEAVQPVRAREGL